MVHVLDDETASLLDGGCALILGCVSDDGRPHALRGWGVQPLHDDGLRLLVLLDSHDEEAVSYLAAGRAVAVTVADVTTLRSVQFKGSSCGVVPAPSDASQTMARYVDQFFDDIVATDGIPRAALERFTPDPADLVGVLIEVREQFDQTPGPGAGRSVADR